MEKQTPNPDWQKIAEARQEKITSMGEFLDNLMRIVNLRPPKTPQEGIGAVQDLITAIQVLQWKETRDREAIETLRAVVGDADKYLDTNKLTTICSGSSLHTAFKDALEATIPVRSPIAEMMREASEPAPRGTCTWKQPKGSDLEESDCYIAECDGSTVTMGEPASDSDMVRCYRCGRKIVMESDANA